jgi:uncharacterized SAM-binding protein YcdF (DUF218 family)
VTPGRLVRWGVVGGVTAAAVVAAYLLLTFVQVWQASGHDELGDPAGGVATADAIVVLGAAQWDGQPSPVFRARLDHGADLWRGGVAPVVVVAGGKQQGDRVTQGFVAYDYLRSLGLPDDAVLVEVEGTDTYSELAAAAGILDANALGADVVLVTDGFHAQRSTLVANEVGLNPVVSPSTTGADRDQLLRETAAVALGRIVGFRRLSNWSSR